MTETETWTYNVHAADVASGELRQKMTGPHESLLAAYRALPGRNFPDGVSVVRSDGRRLGAAAFRECLGLAQTTEHPTRVDAVQAWKIAETQGMVR